MTKKEKLKLGIDIFLGICLIAGCFYTKDFYQIMYTLLYCILMTKFDMDMIKKQ